MFAINHTGLSSVLMCGTQHIALIKRACRAGNRPRLTPWPPTREHCGPIDVCGQPGHVGAHPRKPISLCCPRHADCAVWRPMWQSIPLLTGPRARTPPTSTRS